jgi:hypothetical protein
MRTSVQQLLALSIIILILLPATTLAQTSRRTTTRSTRPSVAQQRASEIQRQGALRVADQIKVLTRFIYLLGGVAKTLEGVDDAARRSQTSGAAVAEQTQRSRTVIRNSIRDVRVGLDKLEIDFRATPELERFYVKLAGVAAGAATAEDLAAANQFDKAGRTLLDVVNRLTDALLAM